MGGVSHPGAVFSVRESAIRCLKPLSCFQPNTFSFIYKLLFRLQPWWVHGISAQQKSIYWLLILISDRLARPSYLQDLLNRTYLRTDHKKEPCHAVSGYRLIASLQAIFTSLLILWTEGKRSVNISPWSNKAVKGYFHPPPSFTFMIIEH